MKSLPLRWRRNHRLSRPNLREQTSGSNEWRRWKWNRKMSSLRRWRSCPRKTIKRKHWGRRRLRELTGVQVSLPSPDFLSPVAWTWPSFYLDHYLGRPWLLFDINRSSAPPSGMIREKLIAITQLLLLIIDYWLLIVGIFFTAEPKKPNADLEKVLDEKNLEAERRMPALRQDSYRGRRGSRPPRSNRFAERQFDEPRGVGSRGRGRWVLLFLTFLCSGPAWFDRQSPEFFRNSPVQLLRKSNPLSKGPEVRQGRSYNTWKLSSLLKQFWWRILSVHILIPALLVLAHLIYFKHRISKGWRKSKLNYR